MTLFAPIVKRRSKLTLDINTEAGSDSEFEQEINERLKCAKEAHDGTSNCKAAS